MTRTPATRNPVRPQILDKPTSKLVDRGHIKTSAEFREFVRQQKTEAERRKADYLTEIAQFETEVARGQADQDTLTARLDAEIQSRMSLIADEDEIISGADAMLTIDVKANRPAPTLSPHTPEAPQHDPAPQAANGEDQTS